ncbi:hypothetical protein OR571_19245 [Psychrobacillus sp. NEAU-3TGS]|uniref:hypothetical protein n=1 Tax=Psychrobacillus sp. NEAU-3TGS TaxID=2995412 RepID=UPI002498DE58|nr:hypothetical protein [Psychrobacillus sp. NEAU-3TGS]MDI2589175.1 hypothetical protein [Psychrobacillus sp. NEAU-3TGS]
MQKKSLTLLGVILAWIVILAFLFVQSQNDEKTLAESMAETKKEHQKVEEFLMELNQTLEHKDFGEIGTTFSYEGRLLTLQVTDQAFIDQNEKLLKTLVQDIAKENKLNAINIQLEVSNWSGSMSEEDKKINELINEVSTISAELLNEKGYSFNAMMVDPRKSNPYVDIRIDETKTYDDEAKGEIQQLISSAIFSKTNMNFDVKITRKSENDIRDEKWQPIFDAIREETDKKFDEYKGFAYSFHPEPLQIIIKTDIPNSKWAWISNKKVEQIETYVHDIIELKREELAVEELPYEVIIRGKDHKRLN